MKKFAKILSVLLCLAMVLSFATAAFAADDAKTFVKVTADQDDWTGTYLLVCESTGYAFNSGLETLDAANNGVAVTVVGDKITTAENIAVTVEKVEGGYVMKAANGQYFYGQSNSNKLVTTTDKATAEAAPITFAFVDGELALVSATSHMRFNPTDNQLRFRFFKEATYSNQAAVSLFKLDEAAEPTAEEVTIPEANEIAKEGNGKKYVVRGTVKEVKNTTYGNMYIEDAEGNTLYIYGLYSADGSTRYDAMEVKPAAGDQVVLLGELSTYNGTAQMKNAWLQSLKVAEKEEEPAPTPDPVEVTIPEANAIAAGKDHNTYTEGKYIVTGVISEIANTTYGNMYIEDAEGNKLYVYGVYSVDGLRFDAMNPQPAVGDTVTLMGVLGQYNGTAQMKNATVTAHTPAGSEPPVEEPPVEEPPVEEPVTVEHNFNSLTDVNLGTTEDKGVIPEGTTFADGFFTVVGTMTQRWQESKGGVYAVEIAKNGTGALQFTTKGTAVVTFVVSSTGSSNTSAVALINVETGEVMANVEGLTEVSTTAATTLTYNNLPAGTYQLVSPESDYNRGFRLMTVHVEEMVEGPATTGDPILVAVCTMLVSGSALAILPKKREF